MSYLGDRLDNGVDVPVPISDGRFRTMASR